MPIAEALEEFFFVSAPHMALLQLRRTRYVNFDGFDGMCTILRGVDATDIIRIGESPAHPKERSLIKSVEMYRNGHPLKSFLRLDAEDDDEE